MDKEKNKKILIFGSFDVLHPGHISLIKQAKKLGHVIAVVARDKTIKYVKKAESFYSEEKRKQHLEDLKIIDEVILGDESDPYKILDQIRPDVCFLGYDQEVFVDKLANKLKEIGLHETKIIRAQEYKPDFFKSSKIKKALNDSKAGFVYINKPTDFTSHDVVAILRRKFNTKAVGHAGTLDPLATGVLILGIGKATKLLDWWHEFPKTYTATLEFGKTSNTYDIEGAIEDIRVDKKNIPDKKLLKQALDKFQGEQDQIPPAFSAKKINGQKAYTLARAGKDVELKSNKITIHNISLLKFNYPTAQIEITCSTGTYIRSIIHDLGQMLNCGAIMTDLVRTNIGFVDLDMCDEINKDSDTPPSLHPVTNLQKEIINSTLK